MDDKEKISDQDDDPIDERELIDRRNFLRGLGKWSLAVIVGVALGPPAEAKPGQVRGWVNSRGGYGGGSAWANRGGGAWANGGGSWINRGGSWVNGGGGGGWVNGRGGGWINRRGY